MPLDPDDALALLRDHPRRFLERHPLRIAGSMPSGVVKCYLDAWNPHPPLEGAGPIRRPGTVLGTLRMHDAEAFTIDGARQSGSAAKLRAHSIAMVPRTDPGDTYIDLVPIDGGPDVLVTGRLTGCSFVIDETGGNLSCGHYQPRGDFTGASLHDWFRDHFTYSYVYGRRDYNHLSAVGPDRSVTIVGVRHHGRWKIYAQKADELHTWSVVSVHRIWPR